MRTKATTKRLDDDGKAVYLGHTQTTLARALHLSLAQLGYKRERARNGRRPRVSRRRYAHRKGQGTS
jgi:hypothetical protein